MMASEPVMPRARSLKRSRHEERRVPARLDLNYITSRIIAASQSVADDEPTYRDDGRMVWEKDVAQNEKRNPESGDFVCSIPQSYGGGGSNRVTYSHYANDSDDTSLSLQSDVRSRKTMNSNTRDGKRRNDSFPLAKFLTKRHGLGNYLLFSLSDDGPDDATLLHMGRQIVQLSWKSSQKSSSELPTVPSLLAICYSLFAWLNMERISDGGFGDSSSDQVDNVALLYCSNGKTRTAIATACYLKFSGQIDRTEDGFVFFLEQRCPESDISPSTVLEALPASIRTFFKNFDKCIDLKQFMNRRPLLLRAIALQGVPVEEKPCLDIYNSRGEHLYSSHPELFEDLVETNSYGGVRQVRSRWVEAEGFFQVNQILEGDFYLLCRFGGSFASDLSDTSKIIFRYANTTGFLGASGPIELRSDQVDLMRRYSHLIDRQEFLLSLVFEASWNCSSKPEAILLRRDIHSDFLPSVLSGYHAMEEGWKQIVREHCAKPLNIDVDLLQDSCEELRECPFHVLSLALQLSNFDLAAAEHMVREGKMRTWWSRQSTRMAAPCQNQPTAQTPHQVQQDQLEIRNKILNLVGGINVLSSIDSNSPRQAIFATTRKSPVGDFEEECTPLKIPDPRCWYTSPLMRPESGDITNAFGKGNIAYPMSDHPLCRGDQPRVPIFPLPLPLKEGEATILDDPRNRKAFEMLMLINHTGVSMNDLLELQDRFQSVGSVVVAEHNGDAKDAVARYKAYNRDDHETEAAQRIVGNTFQASGNNAEAHGEMAQRSPPSIERSRSGEISNQPNDERHIRERNEIPLKDDPSFLKYYTMLKMGIPRGAVENAMTRDGADVSLLDLDPEKSLQIKKERLKVNDVANSTLPHFSPEETPISTFQPNDEAGEPPLKDDSSFSKYYKMLKMGLPRGAVENAMIRDNADVSLLDLDPEKSLKSQRSGQTVIPEPPMKEDSSFSKYYKMMKMGLPRGAVENAMIRDGADMSLLELDPEKSLKSQRSRGIATSVEPLEDDPSSLNDCKMLTMDSSRGTVKHVTTRDRADVSLLGLDPKKCLQPPKADQAVSSDPPLKEDPSFSKYYKMMTMGLPRGAVENAMARDGADCKLLDFDPEKSLLSQTTGNVGDGQVLKDDPLFSKYYKMLKMGLPREAVENAMRKDGAEKSLLDLDPEKTLISQRVFPSDGHNDSRKMMKGKGVRRKKIYWNPINPGRLNEDSLWSLVKGRVQMEKLDYDVREFEDLFTESPNASKSEEKKAVKPTEKKKSVQVIDGKRSMNGGIILKRLRIEYKTLAEMVNSMEVGNLDATSIKALKEYIPTFDERKQLLSYLKEAGDSQKRRAKLYTDLSDCEKYMVCIMEVPKAEEHFNCMLFRAQFRSRFDELTECIKTVEKACDEVRSSERLRQIMAMILTIVNQINTGGEGKGQALGFNLDALLKLNEAKAFDKKTSVLQYFVKVVKRNDESLLDFHRDFTHLPVNIILDSLCTDLKVLKDEIEGVHKTSQDQAEEFVSLGKATKLSLAELKEQKTNVRTLSGVSQYNQIDHLTGRTPMERFTLHAGALIDEAFELTLQVQEKFKKLLQYFGEDEKMTSNDFFGTLKRFIIDFNNANQIVQKEEKLRLREMKKQESMKLGKQRQNSSKKDKTEIVTPIGVNESGSESTASAISAFFASKKADKQSDRDLLPVSDLASIGVSANTAALLDDDAPEDTSSSVEKSVISPPLSKDAGISELNNLEENSGHVNAASALSAFFASRKTDSDIDRDHLPASDSAAVCVSATALFGGDDLTSASSVVKDAISLPLSNDAAMKELNNLEEESRHLNAASAISAFFASKETDRESDRDQSHASASQV